MDCYLEFGLDVKIDDTPHTHTRRVWESSLTYIIGISGKSRFEMAWDCKERRRLAWVFIVVGGWDRVRIPAQVPCSLNLLLASKEEYWGFLLVCPDVGDNGKREGWGLTAFNSETSKNEVRLLIIVPWSLSFMTLKFLKSTVHLVCRILLSLDSSNISSLDSDYTFLVLYIS